MRRHSQTGSSGVVTAAAPLGAVEEPAAALALARGAEPTALA